MLKKKQEKMKLTTWRTSKREKTLASWLVPAVAFGVSFLVASFAFEDFFESFVASTLISIFSSLLVQGHNAAKNYSKVEKVALLSDLSEKLHNIKHPYFHQIAHDKLNSFTTTIQRLSSGTYRVSYENGFVPKGLNLTRHSIKAVSQPWNDEDDTWNKNYLKFQKKLVDNGVVIQRIFLLEDSDISKRKTKMDAHKAAGINVYYLNKTKVSVVLNDDFLVQDDELMVEFEFGRTHQYISINQADVTRKMNRFDQLLEHATPFEQFEQPKQRNLLKRFRVMASRKK